MDYAANGVYNLSFIVQESVAMGKPIMAVSFDCTLPDRGYFPPLLSASHGTCH